MDRRFLNLYLYRGWPAFVLAVWTCRAGHAELQFALPAAGIDVNYDYHAATPELEITHAAPTNDILATRLTFTGGKYLRVLNPASELPLHVDLTLRSPGILDLFHPIFIDFDESLSLLRADGSVFATSSKNSSVGFFVDLRDTYKFGWDFHDLLDDTVHGLQWNITPTLAPGAQLPATVGLAFHVFSPGPIVVIPEPPALLLIASVVSLVIARRRSGGTVITIR